MKTKAAVLYKLNEPLIIEEIEVPELKRGQVLVKVLYSGICGSQRNEILGYKGTDKYLPHLMGHEASGIVEMTGHGVKRIKKNDYVVLTWIKTTGLDAPSSTYDKNGTAINAGAITTLGTHMIVSENRVVKISKKIPPKVASLLGCAIPTGSGTVCNTLKIKPRSSVAIFGIGGIGGGAVLASHYIKKCKIIIAIDINNEKLKFAKKLGATHTINATNNDPLESIKKILPHGVDYAIEAAGSKEAMESAFSCLKDNGMLAIAGNVKDGVKISLTPFELIKGKKIVGTWGGDSNSEKDIPRYAHLFLKGVFPIQKLITHEYPFIKLNEAFNTLNKGHAGRIIVKIS